MLKILVLGPPAILDDEKPLKIQRRQARTLLYYLACQPDGVSRGDVVSRLWKEVNETDGRRNLREILSKLRNEVPDPEAIRSDQDRIWLDPNKVYSDYYAFMALIQPAQSYFGNSQKQNPLPEKIVERLEQAVAIWRAPVFLAGLGIRSTNAFDDWLQSKSNSLDFFRLQSLERLADHFAFTGDLDNAILHLNKALESNPLDEHLQGYLLALFYRAGRFNDAHNYYKFIKDLYQRELEEVPPEILKLAVSEPSSLIIENLSGDSPRGSAAQSDSSRFIGRSKELEQMEDHYTKGGVVIIVGEVGSGKTRFVRQFCSSLVERPKTYFVSCREDESNQPFQPVINLLRDHFVRKDFDKLDTYWKNTLSILAPGLIGKQSSQPASDDFPPLESRQDLFEALLRLLVLKAHGQRSVFILDDIQWIDPDTLFAFMYLFREGFFQKNSFLVLISRVEIENNRVRYMLAPPEEHPTIPRIDIKAFSLQETGLMSKQIFGWEPNQEFIQKLHRSTGGNPLLIEETLHSIMKTGDDRSAIDENNIRFFDNLTSIIEEKEEILDPTSKEILYAAAICGMDFQYEILEFLNICRNEDLVEKLEDLEVKQFIHSQKTLDASGKYSFNHSFFRDSLISRISTARQCYLNEKIALAKIRLRGAQTKRQASTIARHFEIAGKPLMAFHYWIKAAQYARELFSKDEASNAFSRANQIRLDYSQSISEEDLYTLYLEWGDMAFNLMDISSLDECYSGMYEAGVQINSQMLMGAGLNGLGLSAFFSMDLEKALFLLEQSIQTLDKTDNLFEKVQGRYRYGIALSTIGQNEKAIDIYNEAIKLGEGINSQRIRQAVTIVQNYLALLYAILGWPLRSIESGKAALRNAFLLVSKPTTQSATYATLAIAEYYSGRFSESMNYVRQSKKLVENLRNPRILSLMLILESRLNTLQAKMDAGWDLACRALDLATANNYVENISEAHCIRGDIFLTLHMYEEAIHEYKIGNETMPGTHSGLDNLYRLGYTTAIQGDLEKGLEILKSAMELADKIQLGSISIPARYLYAQLLESNGNIDEAKAIFNRVIQEAEKRSFSLKTIPGSIPRLRYLYEHLENSLAEQVIQNLYTNGVIHPGPWIERLLTNFTRNHLYSEQFDCDRFFRFLRAPLQ